MLSFSWLQSKTWTSGLCWPTLFCRAIFKVCLKKNHTYHLTIDLQNTEAKEQDVGQTADFEPLLLQTAALSVRGLLSNVLETVSPHITQMCRVTFVPVAMSVPGIQKTLSQPLPPSSAGIFLVPVTTPFHFFLRDI